MEEMDRLIQEHLSRRGPALHEAPLPTSEEIHRYLEGRLRGRSLERFLDWMRRDVQARDFIAELRRLCDEEAVSGKPAAPASLVESAKKLGPFKGPRRDFAREARLWLWASFLFFAASFIYPRYFMQFLALAVVLAVKGIFDQRAARMQILIYKALQEQQVSKESGETGSAPLSRLPQEKDEPS